MFSWLDLTGKILDILARLSIVLLKINQVNGYLNLVIFFEFF